MGSHLSPAEFMKQWSKARKPGKDMSRMVMFDSTFSLTGMNADDRIRIKPSQQLSVALGLVHELAAMGANVPAAVREQVKGYANVSETLGVEPALFKKIAQDLFAHKGQGLVVAGGLTTQTADAVQLQIAVNLLNSVLGNDGITVDHETAAFETRQGSSREVAQLITDMAAGKIKTLIIHNTNVGYALPADSGFAEAVAKVGMVVYTGNRNDETGRFADYVLPAGTSLEAWGDYQLQTGVYSIQQPTLRPLYDSRSFDESLLEWTQKSKSAPARAKAAKDWYEYVAAVWKSEVYPHAIDGKGKSFDDFWATVLQKGVVETSDRRDRTGSTRTVSTSVLNFKSPAVKSGLELVIFATPHVADGRYANISWIQELPNPVTKMVWDNCVSMSIATARKFSIKDGDKVELKVGDKKLVVPAHIQPGLHDDVLALSIGYGRRAAGKVADGVGADAYQLASFNNGQPVYAGLAASFEKTGEHYKLVSTQAQHILTDDIKDREIVIETTNAAWMKNPAAGVKREKVFSIWPTHQYTKHKWAMSIDLNACTGCSACVIACQSENNIPVVGKKYVMQGREMHWIRIDRYYKGAPEAPEVAFMPLTCQQCENAPCETVCPVIATVHNDEGLNDMVYNRCVGTRYCSNNCPYKVRRFNWFNYSKREEPTHMALNPDVTVRVRGVMEKCTFCVHRIRKVVDKAKGNADAGKVPDGTIKTACQETCPTDAIKFGDLADKNSEVAKLFEDARAYALLEDLNTQPRVRYMTRVRNADRKASASEEGEHA
jgi:molybdopterin-containing oxidoreductase family iron-sulfur binding subunit